MERKLKPLCDRSPVPDSRRIIEKANDSLSMREAVGPVLVSVDAGGTHDSCVARESPRGTRRWSRADSYGFGSRAGREQV